MGFWGLTRKRHVVSFILQQLATRLGHPLKSKPRTKTSFINKTIYSQRTQNPPKNKMGSRQGPPKHQNKFAWKPNAGVKINETVLKQIIEYLILNSHFWKKTFYLGKRYFILWQEVGGRFRPLSEVTGVCLRCKEQIEWKRRYGKYKSLTEPAKWYFLFLLCLHI